MTSTSKTKQIKKISTGKELQERKYNHILKSWTGNNVYIIITAIQTLNM